MPRTGGGVMMKNVHWFLFFLTKNLSSLFNSPLVFAIVRANVWSADYLLCLSVLSIFALQFFPSFLRYCM